MHADMINNGSLKIVFSNYFIANDSSGYTHIRLVFLDAYIFI